MEQINLFLAFGAGLLSFLSPCALPLYPAFLSYITGMTVDELKAERGILRKKAFIHTILFLLGFSIIFLALGLSTSFIGSFFIAHQGLLRQLGAILMVFFGLDALYWTYTCRGDGPWCGESWYGTFLYVLLCLRIFNTFFNNDILY